MASTPRNPIFAATERIGIASVAVPVRETSCRKNSVATARSVTPSPDSKPRSEMAPLVDDVPDTFMAIVVIATDGLSEVLKPIRLPLALRRYTSTSSKALLPKAELIASWRSTTRSSILELVDVAACNKVTATSSPLITSVKVASLLICPLNWVGVLSRPSSVKAVLVYASVISTRTSRSTVSEAR